MNTESRVGISDLMAVVIISFLVQTTPAASQVNAPIMEDELKRYTRWLRLNDDQIHLMKQFHQEYEAQSRADVFEDARNYWQALQHLSRRADGRVPGAPREDPATFLHREYAFLEAQRLDLTRRKTELDAQFFDDVRSLLSKEALPRMQRVELGRTRLFYNRYRGGLPGGNVDLMELIDSLPLEQDDYDRIEREFIMEFEPLWVAAVERRMQNDRACGVRYFEVRALRYRLEYGGLSELEQSQLGVEILRLNREIGKDRIGPELMLVDLNSRSIPTILELLPEDLRPVFMQQWLETSYPMVYPDPADAEVLYAHAYELDDLTDDQRTAVESLHQRFSWHHDLLTERMAEAVFFRRRAGLAGDPPEYGMSSQHEVTVLNIGEQREVLNQQQLSLLAMVLSPEQMAGFPEWDFKKNPRPRPWDLTYEDRRKDAIKRQQLESFREPGAFERYVEKRQQELKQQEEEWRKKHEK